MSRRSSLIGQRVLEGICTQEAERDASRVEDLTCASN